MLLSLLIYSSVANTATYIHYPSICYIFPFITPFSCDPSFLLIFHVIYSLNSVSPLFCFHFVLISYSPYSSFFLLFFLLHYLFYFPPDCWNVWVSSKKERTMMIQLILCKNWTLSFLYSLLYLLLLFLLLLLVSSSFLSFLSLWLSLYPHFILIWKDCLPFSSLSCLIDMIMIIVVIIIFTFSHII